MLIMASVLTLVSCGKEPAEPVNPQPDGDQPAALTAQDLAGTSWRCSMENTIVRQGIQINISFESILDFTDTANGEYFEMAIMEVPAYPSANQQTDMSVGFTYSVQGNSLFITVVWTDDETGEETIETAEYTYDPDTQTISLDTNSPDMEQLMGTDVYVYTKMQ